MTCLPMNGLDLDYVSSLMSQTGQKSPTIQFFYVHETSLVISFGKAFKYYNFYNHTRHAFNFKELYKV